MTATPHDSASIDTVNVWDKVEVTLVAARRYANPYTEVVVWVDLEGPGFERRVYGFWDGGNTFRVRLLATQPGVWSWTSGSNQDDAGLSGHHGRFIAEAWSEEELAANPCRRGIVRATANGHALEYPDGTPFFLLGDTWWATPTFRYPWHEDDEPRPIGPGMGFKDMVRYRRAQGYNAIAMLAALPAWANDGHPAQIWLDEAQGLGVRDAWQQAGTSSAKDMHNEGGRAFLFPGRVPGYRDVFPDVDRLNPAYFQAMDRKVDYLNAQGMVVFIEAARRDLGMAWKTFYDWPESYARYVQYVFCRYQANNSILSPIHFDWTRMSPPGRAYNEPAHLVLDTYGPPPFGNLLSANASGSTYANFGREARWVTLHQIGNWREHNAYWYLTEIYRDVEPPRPALNGEPFYPGWPPSGIAGDSVEAERASRSGMYGSFLSGGLAGHIYGAQGLWGGDIEPEASPRMWESLQWRSGDQLRHLGTFALSEGARYRDLAPDSDLVYPQRTVEVLGNSGWAYCARTPDRTLFMLYFERGLAGFGGLNNPRRAGIRGALRNGRYRATWYDPRTGAWHDAGTLASDESCLLPWPEFPDEEDWALKLVAVGAP